ncbi:MAG: carboxypeptidase regulatory-like domain-containing protein [Deltaproteobacteria bacterium]|nr:carboxypeptidase regulatory-like domain-containing protein [Deltaproteobacteria bacterium]
MKSFRIILLLLFSFLLLDQNASAANAELYGQVLYRNGGPVSYVEVIIVKGEKESDSTSTSTTTNRSGFYSKELKPGEYTLKVKGKEKEKKIFLSPRGTRVDFKISKD